MRICHICPANGWEQSGGKWYYFDAAGNMLANQWVMSAGNPHVRYYVGPNGDMLMNQYVGQFGSLTPQISRKPIRA